jgi:hypothetical protein
MPLFRKEVIYMFVGSNTLSTNSGLAAIVSSESTLLAAENYLRRNITIQNTSTVAALIKLGDNAQSTDYNFILGADTTLKSGNGGNIEMKTWKGSISSITLSTGTHYVVVAEEVE